MSEIGAYDYRRRKELEVERDELITIATLENETLKDERDRYRIALKIVKANSLNPEHTMTMLGLEEVTDANFSIAQQALKEVGV